MRETRAKQLVQSNSSKHPTGSEVDMMTAECKQPQMSINEELHSVVRVDEKINEADIII